jgi:hypothetical protein
MPPGTASPFFPSDDDALADLHSDVAMAFAHHLRKVGEAFALTFGEGAAHAGLRALLVETSYPVDLRPELCALFDRIGWREFLEDQITSSIDSIELTQLWRDAAEYAGQGLAPHERPDHPPSLMEREARIRALIERGKVALDCAASIVGDEYDYIWKGVAARGAVDFGGPVSLDGLQLLSGLSLAAVRNSVSIGDLHPDEAGNVSSKEARAWLARRREFCPSRWKNLADDQWSFDPSKVVTPDDKGMIWVPQSAEGETFVPDLVVRPARGPAGISITIGAKGEEVRHHDFYEALTALAKMDVARWRRRNSVGNWGIVRARGAWVAVSKAEIDAQLTKKLAEVS